MENPDKSGSIKFSLLFKISGMFCLLLVFVAVILTVMNVFSNYNSNLEVARMMGKNQLSGDMEYFTEKIMDEYGQLSLINGNLTDGNGNSIKNDFRVVDEISSALGVKATIFMKDGQDYRRVSTSLVDNTGKRAVDTFLGAGAVYNTVQSGNDYFGDVTLFGKNYTSEYAPIYASNNRDIIGIMVLGIDMGNIEAYIMSARNSNIISSSIEAVILLVITGFISLFFIRKIIKPVINVTSTLKDISEGEGDLTKTITIKNNDEVGELSRFFNLTIEKIKALVLHIKKEIVILSDIGEGLATDMNETAAAVNEISANITNMKDRIQSQSTTVSETHTTMEELTGNIHRLDTHVVNQSSHITQSSAAIEEMVANIQSVISTLIKNNANVKNLTDASEVGRSGLSGVASDIQEIAKESEGLLEINSVMQNIASQTNLLSMNAAIEAAHAGEAGRGFAVVADEIRKLAENSSAQSKTISTVLKKIKESIDKITHSTKNVLSRFEDIDSNVRIVSEQEEIIRSAMEEQGVGSKQILTGIEEVNEITRQVESDSNEMLKEAQEVIAESKKLDQVTQEINSGMVEMSLGVEQINVAMNDINEISNKNRDGIDFLIGEVARFKVE